LKRYVNIPRRPEKLDQRREDADGGHHDAAEAECHPAFEVRQVAVEAQLEAPLELAQPDVEVLLQGVDPGIDVLKTSVDARL
jgi:hypothetical protein